MNIGEKMQMKIEELQHELEAVKKREQALTAHLNAPVIDNAVEALGHAQYWQEKEEVESWKAGAPNTSLARLKAQWQAEALERHAEGIARDNEPTDTVCVEDVHTLLLHEASKLRRQSEGEE